MHRLIITIITNMIIIVIIIMTITLIVTSRGFGLVVRLDIPKGEVMGPSPSLIAPGYSRQKAL